MGRDDHKKERCFEEMLRQRESSKYRVEIPSTDEDPYRVDQKRNAQLNASSQRSHSRSSSRLKGLRDDFSDMVGTDYSIDVSSTLLFAEGGKDEDVVVQDTPRNKTCRQLEHKASDSAHRDSSRSRSKRRSEVSTSNRDKRHSRSDNEKKAPPPSSSSTKAIAGRYKHSKKFVNNDEPLVPKRHLSWMPFGYSRTCGAILLMAMGITLAVFARWSTAFVKLERPLGLTPHMKPVTDVGLVRLHLCYSDDYLNALVDPQVTMPYMNSSVSVTDETTIRVDHSSCFTVRLSAELIEDTMWEVARLSASFAIALGAFFCMLLISTVYWESINMKAMAVGLLITYLLQSFSFFFYDSQLCRQHECKLAAGTYLSILASFCWFGASMMCILMDVHHARKMRLLAKLERRRRRQLRKQEKFKRKSSTATTQTSSSSSGSSDVSLSQHFVDSPSAIIEEDVVEPGIVWQV